MMRKSSALFGSLLFLVIAPGTFAGLLPWWISLYRFPNRSSGLIAIQIPGAFLILGGLIFLLDSFARFALEGLGTPAPIAPPKHLVVTGWYRSVRNPMYVAVLAIIVGQALLFVNVALLAYAAAVWLSFAAFVIGYEEPALREKFGQEYILYCARVPRWIPRLRTREQHP